jgi:hypothetical protein
MEEQATPPTLTLLFKRGHTYRTCRSDAGLVFFALSLNLPDGCFPSSLNRWYKRVPLNNNLTNSPNQTPSSAS